MAQLDDVRNRIRDIDERLVGLVADRVAAGREAGRLKRELAQPIRDFDTEGDVVARIRQGFATQNLDPELGAAIARLLIRESVRVQEEDGLVPAGGARGKALIVGGSGRMGRWFSHFLNGQGFEVVVSDPSGPVEGFGFEPDPAAGARDAELVVLSTPPSAVKELLHRVERSDALVFDICSLKGPFQDDLVRLARDHRVTSVHPLWGPRTRVLSDKNLLALDCGNAEAMWEVKSLFTPTAVNVVTMPVTAHDPMMALTLGLPHALNLVYADVISSSGHAFFDLRRTGGPTFIKQSDVAAEVASENPALYREIQALNDATPETYQALHDAIDRLEERMRDPVAFRDAMERFNAYLGEPKGVLFI